MPGVEDRSLPHPDSVGDAVPRAAHLALWLAACRRGQVSPDDFVDAATMYSLYLKHHGFEVVTALDGHEALEAANGASAIELGPRAVGWRLTDIDQWLEERPHSTH